VTQTGFRSGLVTLLGRPNVGKSTLLNRLIGTKISITSRRPQTTRHRILGIKTDARAQFVYVDTPGVHHPHGRRINRYMSRIATGSVEGVDCVVLVIAADGWRDEDEPALALAGRQSVPVVLAVNKIDRTKDRKQLLPLIAESASRMGFADIVPVSARTGENIETLEQAVLARLPEQPAIYPPEQLTDKSERFLASELVREQVFGAYGEEVPYATAIEVTRFKRLKGVLEVEAIIWVEKEGQKAIVIGKGGERLKEVGTRARLAMQRQFGTKVRLSLWVKVRADWADDARLLERFGYTEEST
jgi:GTP-binding protein Era